MFHSSVQSNTLFCFFECLLNYRQVYLNIERRNTLQSVDFLHNVSHSTHLLYGRNEALFSLDFHGTWLLMDGPSHILPENNNYLSWVSHNTAWAPWEQNSALFNEELSQTLPPVPWCAELGKAALNSCWNSTNSPWGLQHLHFLRGDKGKGFQR